MKTIKSSTKRGAAFLQSYKNSYYYSLQDCYNNYSCRKAVAENDCRRWMYQEAGHGFKILSFNTFGFTCGWITVDGLRIETPAGSYLVK